jgi:polyisoprenoid-binding protein YceI
MKTALLAILLLTTAAFAGDRYTPAAGSLVRVEGTSTLHAWTMEGSTINGSLDVTDTVRKSGSAVVSIPVSSIRAEHDRMNRLMADALKAKSNPDIRFELTSSAQQSGDAATFTLKTAGKLTIAGVTRDVAMDVSGIRNADGRYTLTGTLPIRMSDYGVTPPTAMMNTIKTGNDVKVTFRWVVAAAK